MTMAMTNSFVYRELKNFDLTPELRRYVDSRLRALKAINAEVDVNDPLRRRVLKCTPARRGLVTVRGAASQSDTCATCSVVRPCFCD